MTVVQPSDLADVFEHLGSACVKLSQILRDNSSSKGSAADALAASNPALKKIKQITQTAKLAANVGSESASAPASKVLRTVTMLGDSLGAYGSQPKPRRVKKPRDPNTPKRPPSAFLLYSIERRPAAARENPELRFIDVSTLLAREWDEADRTPYFERARELKARYMAERDEYMKRQAKIANDAALGHSAPNDSAAPSPAAPLAATEEEESSKASPKKRPRAEDTPLPSSQELVSTQDPASAANASETQLAPEAQVEPPAVASEPTQTGAQEPEKKKKKKKKSPSATETVDSVPASVVAAATQSLSIPQPHADVAVVVPEAPVTGDQNSAGEKKKKKKKKVKSVEAASEVASQISSIALSSTTLLPAP